MKKLLFLFTALLLAETALACLGASQNRLFPIGSCSEGIIFVETHMNRGEIEEWDMGWGGISFFSVYSEAGELIQRDTIERIPMFRFEKYEARIGKIVVKGTIMASKMKDFVPIEPQAMTRCGNRKDCSMANLAINADSSLIEVNLPGKGEFDVDWLLSKDNSAFPVIDWYRQWSEDFPRAVDMYDRLYLGSVREYRIGDKTLTVMQIGGGQIMHSATGEPDTPGDERAPNFDFKDPRKAVFYEGVMHHGYGFDFFVVTS